MKLSYFRRKVNRVRRAIASAITLGMFILACCGPMEGAAQAQLVVGTKPSLAANAQITLYDLSGQQAPRVLTTGYLVIGMTADEATQTLYWVTFSPTKRLYKAAYTTSGAVTPVLVGTFPAAADAPMNGLAWDSVDHQLIGFDSVGRVWAISTADATMTLLWTMPNYSDLLFGATFDPATNAFYGVPTLDVNYPTQGPAGILRVNKPLTAPTVSETAGYPGNLTGFTDIALGNGRLYMVAGTTAFNSGAVTDPHRVYNLATNTYETSPQITLASIQGAAWAPGLITPPAGTNLAVSAGASRDCSVAAGGTLAFSVRIDNYGANTSGPVTVTVDLSTSTDATFAGSVPAPTSITPTQLVYTLPSIPGYGPTAYANVQIFMSAVTPGATASISASATVAADIDPSNNAASASTRIQPVAPTTAAIKGIFTSNPSFPNSLIPGGGGLRFEDFYDPTASDNGGYWSIVGGYLQPPNLGGNTLRQVAIRSSTGGTPQRLLAVDSTAGPGTSLPGGLVLKSMTFTPRINSSGLVLFNGGDSGPSTSDGFTAVTADGSAFTVLAREGNPVPAMPGVNYSGSGAVKLFDNGTAALSVSSNPSGSGALVIDSGATLVARQGVTIPNGVSQALSNSPQEPGFDTTGSHSIYRATLSTGSSSNDSVVVVDGTVVLQENTTVIPGASRTFNATARSIAGVSTYMGPDGHWMLLDTASAGNHDVVIRGLGPAITDVFKTGDPIFTGATENWSDTGGTGSDFDPANTFFTYQPGPGGHFVIGGFTDQADDWRDSVLVYDNVAVIARENDPVDLDGNGVFDDHLYIRSFVRTGATSNFNGVVAFTNDHAILISVALRNEESALGHTNDVLNSRALVRIPLPITGACCVDSVCRMVLGNAACTGSYAGDDSVCGPAGCPAAIGACCNGTACSTGVQSVCGGVYQGDNSSCGTAGNPTTCCPANFDGVNGVTVADIFVFLSAWFGGEPAADFNHADGITVADIFAFLSAWFAGGCS